MKPDTRSFYTQAVQQVIEHVAAHLDEALELERLASSACLSPFHFHRVFRGMVGETPVELIRRLRLERAAWRLAHTDQSVTAIAFDAGYETHEAFTRAFRAAFGVPPSGFRQRKRVRIELAASSGVHFDPSGHTPLFTPRDSGGRTMDVEIKEMPQRRVGAVRHTGAYNQISEAFERLGAAAGQGGLFAHPGAEMIAIFHDDPDSTPVEALRSDAAITVPEGVPLPPSLVEQRIPAGRYASTVHVGDYERLGDTWARFLGEWVPASGHRVRPGVSYELYLNNPTNTPKDQLRTQINVPIE